MATTTTAGTTDSSQFAKPVFLAGVNDSLATIDSYTNSAKGVINSATSQFKAVSGSILDALRALKIKDNLQYLSKLLNGATKLNVSDLLNRLSQTFPELKMLAKTVNDAKALGASFEKACQQIYKEYQQVLGQINGIIGVLDGTNFNSAVSLSSMVNSLTGNGFAYGISDANAQAALYASLINQSMQINVPGVLDALTKNITNYVTLDTIVKAVGTEIVNNASVYSLQAAADNSAFAALLYSNYPSFIADFAAKFKLPAGATSSDYASLARTILQSFRKIDASWDASTREGDTAGTVNLSIVKLLGGSSDFKKVVMAEIVKSEDLQVKFYGLMMVYPLETVKQRIKIDFPRFTFTSTTNPTGRFINPLQYSALS